MTTQQRLELRDEVETLFHHGFDDYMEYAFPEDELRPLSCSGRGSDKSNPKNLGINDVCGDFSLTLIDSLDMLAVMNDQIGFEKGVRNVIDTVTFDVDSKVQIFEVTIRVLGGLLSAHQYATMPLLNATVGWYNGELLDLALDLGHRLLPAFESPSGIPYPRINLRHGMSRFGSEESTENCAAGAGSLVLEFAVLSQLTGLEVFEQVATRAFKAVWARRLELGLVGNTIDAQTGLWTTYYTSVGAGIDSFYEYALKAWVLLGDEYFYDVWMQSHISITNNLADSEEFYYRNINARTGFLVSNYIDSLSAFYSGLLVLAGEVEQAIKSHLVYHSLWTRFHAIPERFNFVSRQVEIPWYPLRPEFIESTYFLYRATKDPFYLSVGRQVLDDLKGLKQSCGFAGLGNVVTRSLDDRMESFMLSESLKYLYLLFDEEHVLNRLDSNWVFTTEGHPVFLQPIFRKSQDFTSVQSNPGACQVSSNADFFSRIMSRSDFTHAQRIAGLDLDQNPLPSYFPSSHPNSISNTTATSVEFDVLFGSVASNVLNASASIVQIGKNLIINSLLGLKIRFSHVGTRFLATRIGSLKVNSDAEIYIKDIGYEAFTTQDLITFTPGETAELEVMPVTDNSPIHRVTSTISLHGTPLPRHDLSLDIISMLTTTNSKGCLCPAVLGYRNTSAAEDTALVMYRGECSFFEKTANAFGTARLIIVVDEDIGSSASIRPTLLDDEGNPMSPNASYPSLVMVQGPVDANFLGKGKTVVVKAPRHEDQTRLLVRGEIVGNVFVG